MNVYTNTMRKGIASKFPIDDAATVNWGRAWRMPTIKELQELLDGCTWEDGTFKGSDVKGVWGTSKTNGNRIFIPYAGHFSSTLKCGETEEGSLWSSSLDSTSSAGSYSIDFPQYEIRGTERCLGNCVRAVVK